MNEYDEDDIDLSEIIKNDISEYTDSKLTDLIKEQHLGDSMFSTPNDELPKQEIIPYNTNTVLADEYDEVSNLNDDFELIRKNMIQLTTMGNQLLGDIIALAKATEHPNGFKSATETLTALSQMNLDLLNAYEKKINIENKLKKAEADKLPAPQNQQNNFFMNETATTDDMFKLLKDKGLIGKKDE